LDRRGGKWWEAGEDCIMRSLRLEGNVACMGEVKNAYKILVEMSEERKALGRSRHR